MSKQDKKGLVPALRFPEFRGAGEWEHIKLGKIANFYKGKGISKADISPNGRQPCIRYGELYTVYGEVIDEVISKTDISSDVLFLSVAGDVIIPSSGETKIDIATAACVAHNDIALGGDLNVIRSEQNGFFLSYYVNGALKYKIAKVAQGDTVVHLYRNNLESLDLALPPRSEEQQKIADCLSSLDALITAHTQKHQALQSYKKGLMQNLFPAEADDCMDAGGRETQDAKAETVPALRFPEFRDSEGWNTEILGDICTPQQWTTISSSDLVEQGYSVYGANGFIGYYSEFNHEFETVAVTCRGSTCGEVSLIPPRSYITGNSMCLDGIDGSKISYRFVYQILQGRGLKDIISGSAQPQIVGNAIKKLEILLPGHKEQRRIADGGDGIKLAGIAIIILE